MDRVMNWICEYPGWFLVFLLTLVLGLFIWAVMALEDNAEQVRRDCAKANGTMIGETCHLPNHTPVEQPNSDTVIIMPMH